MTLIYIRLHFVYLPFKFWPPSILVHPYQFWSSPKGVLIFKGFKLFLRIVRDNDSADLHAGNISWNIRLLAEGACTTRSWGQCDEANQDVLWKQHNFSVVWFRNLYRYVDGCRSSSRACEDDLLSGLQINKRGGRNFSKSFERGGVWIIFEE